MPSLVAPTTGSWYLLTPGRERLAERAGRGDGIEARVHPDRTGRRADRLGRQERVGKDPRDHGLRGLVDEVLLALDAPEVTARILAPLSVAELLEMATAGVLQGLQAVEDVAAGLLVEPGVLVTGDVQEADLGAPDGVDDVLEAGEVDLDHVMDRDPEFLRDRGGEHVGAVAVRRVDAVLGAPAGDGHPQVARQADQRRAVAVLLLAQDHDRVAALARHRVRVADAAVVGVVRVGRGPRVRPDQEVVDRRAVLGLEHVLEPRDPLHVGRLASSPR